SGPLRKVPAGISTVPMPPALAELMAFWIAVVLVVTPSPTAPKAVTLLVPGGIVGRAGEAPDALQAASKPKAAVKKTNSFRHALSIPKGMCPPAQQRGCEERATLGKSARKRIQSRKGLGRLFHARKASIPSGSLLS